MDTGVYFTPSCPGYSYPTDGLGNAGAALHPVEGGSGTITMTKTGTPSPPDAGTPAVRLLGGAVPQSSRPFATGCNAPPGLLQARLSTGRLIGACPVGCRGTRPYQA